jgi:hypothetical protein
MLNLFGLAYTYPKLFNIGYQSSNKSLDTLIQIKFYCDQIDTNSNLMMRSINLNDLSTEGGIAEQYTYNSEVLKIQVILYSEYGNRVITSYYKSDAMLRITEQYSFYSEPIFIDEVTDSTSEFIEYYFMDNKVIKKNGIYIDNCIENSQEVKGELDSLLSILRTAKALF